MTLHQNKTDRFIDITARKHNKNIRFKPQSRYTDAGDHKKVHENDLKDRTVSGVPGRAIGIILRPVAHTDDRGDTVNTDKAGADGEGFPRKAHGTKQRRMDGKQHRADNGDTPAAKEHKAFCTFVSAFRLSRADAFSDQNRSGV